MKQKFWFIFDRFIDAIIIIIYSNSKSECLGFLKRKLRLSFLFSFIVINYTTPLDERRNKKRSILKSTNFPFKFFLL